MALLSMDAVHSLDIRLLIRLLCQAASFSVLVGSLPAAPGDLYVSVGIRESGDSPRIVKIRPDGLATDFVNGEGTSFRPFAIAFAPTGELFVVHGSNTAIRKYALDGSFTPFASGLHRILALCFDAAGNLF